MRANKKRTLYFVLIVFACALLSSFFLPDFFSVKYDGKVMTANVSNSASSTAMLNRIAPIDGVGHILAPAQVKALYMTSWIASGKKLRQPIIDLIDRTEANAVVIDIKDYTGMVSFETGVPAVDGKGCIERRIKDLPALIEELHAKGIYVIGRIAVFQDPCYVKKHPEVAVKTQSTGDVWKDKKGLTWVDMGSRDAWRYNVEIARASYALGFDEINFDYVRYPSDGNMKDIKFISGDQPKKEVFRQFFEFLDKELRGGKATLAYTQKQPATTTASTTAAVTPEYAWKATDPAYDAHRAEITGKAKPEGAGRMITSADLFGMVTTQNDDLGIGQILEYAIPYVDYVGPMVYPSHYPNGWNGFANPAAKPYEVIKIAMGKAVQRTKAMGLNPLKLRPWLQDFNLGATYTAEMVRAQIRATYDVGLDSWMIWDASNTYTAGALESKLSKTQ